MTLEELFDLLLVQSSLMFPATSVTIRIRDGSFDTVPAASGNYFQSQIQQYIRRNVEEFSIDLNSDHLEAVVDGDLIL